MLQYVSYQKYLIYTTKFKKKKFLQILIMMKILFHLVRVKKDFFLYLCKRSYRFSFIKLFFFSLYISMQISKITSYLCIYSICPIFSHLCIRFHSSLPDVCKSFHSPGRCLCKSSHTLYQPYRYLYNTPSQQITI